MTRLQHLAAGCLHVILGVYFFQSSEANDEDDWNILGWEGGRLGL
jgi:hypothetical protein